MAPCSLCPPSAPARALLRRPKTLQPVCKECFFLVFETEIHHTILGLGQAELNAAAATSSGGRLTRREEEVEEGEGKEKKMKGKGLFRRGERVAIGASGGKGKRVVIISCYSIQSQQDSARVGGYRAKVQEFKRKKNAYGGVMQDIPALPEARPESVDTCDTFADRRLRIIMTDSTVLAHIMTLLNDRYDYGLDLCLLSIDEGISGYRDDSLEVCCFL